MFGKWLCRLGWHKMKHIAYRDRWEHPSKDKPHQGYVTVQTHVCQRCGFTMFIRGD